MASKKFSDFVEKTNENEVNFIVGYSGDENVRIDPSVLSGTTDYNNLTNKPTIPTDNSQLSNGAGYVTTDTNTQRTDQEIRDVIATEGYLTSETDSQTLSVSGQELTISNGNTVVVPDTNTQLSDADIAAMGYIKTDTNTQLSDSDIASFGYIKTDTNTQRTDQEIRDVVATEGYITSETPQTLSISGQDLTLSDGGGTVTIPSGGSGGGASDLNGLSDCLVDTDSLYVGEVPSGLSGNPQGNTVLGIDAGIALTSGNNNTFFGNDAGKSITTGQRNTIIGTQSGDANTTGNRNVFIGNGAGGSSSDGGENTIIGTFAFGSATRDVGTVGIGAGVLGNQNAGFLSGYNTAIGHYAGSSITTGQNNTIIGRQADASSATASNEITLGNSSITALRCAVTSITSLSDERDKTEIKNLGYGLAFVDALQPREFVWDNRPETDKDGKEFYSLNKGKKDFGFIAQEVKELDNDTLRLVYTENEDRFELSYGKLVPILTQAIKELKAEVDSLKTQIGN